MSATARLALANIPFPDSPEQSVTAAQEAIARASAAKADIVCFPECFVPGYRGLGKTVAPADAAFLERAWSAVAAAAAKADVAVVLGTERVVDGGLRISALVVNRDGTRAGFQDKVQLDPSEEATYAPGSGRRVFQSGPLTFGVSICHEGWRYPETVRWAGPAGRAGRIPPAFPRGGAGQLPADALCRSRELVPREGRALPRRREHVLLRDGELRERGLPHHFRCRAPRRHAALLSALRRAPGC